MISSWETSLGGGGGGVGGEVSNRLKDSAIFARVESNQSSRSYFDSTSTTSHYAYQEEIRDSMSSGAADPTDRLFNFLQGEV